MPDARPTLWLSGRDLAKAPGPAAGTGSKCSNTPLPVLVPNTPLSVKPRTDSHGRMKAMGRELVSP